MRTAEENGGTERRGANEKEREENMTEHKKVMERRGCKYFWDLLP